MKTSYYTDNRLYEQKVKIIEKYYKEEVIKEIFDNFDDEYRCNEYILITHKSVNNAIMKIHKGVYPKAMNHHLRVIIDRLHNEIIEQIREVFNLDMTCGFYNTSTREFETDQEKINILKMMTQASLEIDEADYRNKFYSIMYSEYDIINMI